MYLRKQIVCFSISFFLWIEPVSIVFILKKKLLEFLLPKPFLILYEYIYNSPYEMSKWMLVSFYFIFVPAWKCHFLFLSDLKGKVNIDYYFFYINGDESLILGVFIASIMEQMTAMMAVIQRNKQRMLIFAYLSFLLLYIPIPSSPPLCMGTFISQSLVGR